MISYLRAIQNYDSWEQVVDSNQHEALAHKLTKI